MRKYRYLRNYFVEIIFLTIFLFFGYCVEGQSISITNINSTTVCQDGNLVITYSSTSGNFDVDVTFIKTGGGTVVGSDNNPTSTTATIDVPNNAASGFINVKFDFSGGSSMDTTIFDAAYINILAEASVFGLSSTYCSGDSPVTITGFPLGGSFSSATQGTTISNSSGNAGIGTYTPGNTNFGANTTVNYNIVYAFANGACASETKSVAVSQSPANIANIPSLALGLGELPIDLDDFGITPAGGSFSGTAVTTSTGLFNPTTTGNYTITYSVGPNNCKKTANFVITVLPPVVNALSPSPVCPGQFLHFLGNYFDGPVLVTFSTNLGSTTVTSAIVRKDSISVVVPTAAISGNLIISIGNPASQFQFYLPVGFDGMPQIYGLTGPYCTTNPSIQLGANPSGGLFSGQGVTSGGGFSPGMAGPGTHTITYTLQNTCGLGGMSSVSQQVTVNASPSVSANPTTQNFSINAPQTNLFNIVTVSPNGGVFSGPGVTNNFFTPSAAGEGTHTINYLYFDGGQCSSAASFTLTVGSEVAGLASFYCQNDNTVTFGRDANQFSMANFPNMTVNSNLFNPVAPFGQPALVNTGAETWTFNPSLLPQGNYVITVDYSGGAGGPQTLVANIEIRVPPATPTLSLSPPPGPYCPEINLINMNANPGGGNYFLNNRGLTGASFGRLDTLPTIPANHQARYTITSNQCTSNPAIVSFQVYSTTPPTYSAFPSSLCRNETSVTINASPPGGVLSGPGVIQGTQQINPSLLATGKYGIKYTITDGNNCSVSVTDSVNIVNPVSVAIQNLPAKICINAAQIALVGSPLGGSFTIVNPGGGNNGISGGFFNPATAGLGFHTITYTYPNPGSPCTSTISNQIEVLPLPVVSISGLANQYCVQDTAIILSGTPTGGTFSIINPNGMMNGVNGNQFNPATAGTGTHTVRYTYMDPTTMCTNIFPQSVVVAQLPTPTFSAAFGSTSGYTYCNNSSPDTLAGSPPGGIFSGPGVVSSGGINTFVPASVQPNTTHTITYTVGDPNGCFAKFSRSFTINATPTVLISNLPAGYCINQNPFALMGVPNGGAWSIVNPNGGSNGLSGSIFNPATAGVGTHQITYTYSDGNNCTNSKTQNISVFPLPVTSFTGLDTAYCQVNTLINLSGEPAPNTGMGGLFSILNPGGGNMGVFGTQFNPSVANVGNHTVTYQYTDNMGCTNSFSRPVRVNPLPTVNFDGIQSQNNNMYCLDAPLDTLTGTPAGGQFTGSGIFSIVSGGTSYFFDPSLAQQGTHNITYQFTDGNNCTNVDIDTFRVNPLPNVQLGGLEDQYCEDEPADMINVNVGGGVYSVSIENMPGNNSNPGIEVQGNNTFFNPQAIPDAILGRMLVINYTVTNPVTGCVGKDSVDVEVHGLPGDVRIIGLSDNFCEGGPTVSFNVTPIAGGFGTFQIHDVQNNTTTNLAGAALTPAQFQTGIYNIIYRFTDFNGCAEDTSQQIVIHPNPVASYIRWGNCEGGDLALVNASYFEPGDTGTITTYLWDYLNRIVTTPNDFYINPPPGPFQVEFTVGTTFGCKDDTISTGLIIGNDPRVDFRAKVVGDGPNEFTRFEVFDPADPGNPNATFGLNMSFDSLQNFIYNFGLSGVPEQPSSMPQYWYHYPQRGKYNATVGILTDQTCRSDTTKPVFVVPRVNSYPYLENFNAGPGGWLPISKNHLTPTVWEHGIATGDTIKTPGNPGWHIRLDQDTTYARDINSWVYGPCFDLTELDRPMISLDIWNSTEVGFDGAVMEYSTNGLNWELLGNVGKGINWYNGFVLSEPGEHNFPIGWTGGTGGFVSARYKLDGFKDNNNFCIRIAFGSDDNNPAGTRMNGFAFDNVRVGERKRNVLFEHFTNLNQSGGTFDQVVYSKLLQNNATLAQYNPLDVVLTQYHIEFPSPDQIHLANTADPSARTLFYGISQPGKAKINGFSFGQNGASNSNGFTQLDLDKAMLQDPKFSLVINNFAVTNGNASMNVTATALESIPFQNLDLHLVVLENNIGAGGSTLKKVLRRMLPSAAGTPFEQTWNVNQTATVSEGWNFNPANINQNNLEAVAFIQNRDTKEVYQVVSTADVSIFTEVDPLPEQAKLVSAVYPNPTSNSLNISFYEPVQQNVEWRMIDAGGRMFSSGKAGFGTKNFRIDTSALPAGFYLLEIGHPDIGIEFHKIAIIH